MGSYLICTLSFPYTSFEIQYISSTKQCTCVCLSVSECVCVCGGGGGGVVSIHMYETKLHVNSHVMNW